MTRRNRGAYWQALHDLWRRGGVDIPAPVIKLLTEWDRVGGHSIEDPDYGSNLWDRLIIVGIWPIELLVSGSVSLLIIAIIVGKRLNFDLREFRGDSWSTVFVNLGEAVALVILVGSLMLLAGYVRQKVSAVWSAYARLGRIMIITFAASITGLAWFITDLQQSYPNLAVGDERIDWLISILWHGLGYIATAIMALVAVVTLLVLLAAQGPEGPPRTWLRTIGGMVRDLERLTARRLLTGSWRTYAWIIAWILAAAGLLELARIGGSASTPVVTASLMVLAAAGLVWLSWPALSTVIAVAGIILTIILVAISGTLIPAILLVGWAVCLWRIVGVRAAGQLPAHILASVQWLLTVALSTELFRVYVLV